MVEVGTAQTCAGARDARADRADGDAERNRDLLVAEVGPGEEEQRLAFAAWKRTEGRGEIGGDRLGKPRLRPTGAARVGVETSLLRPPVSPQQVGGDPEQPRRASTRARS